MTKRLENLVKKQTMDICYSYNLSCENTLNLKLIKFTEEIINDIVLENIKNNSDLIRLLNSVSLLKTDIEQRATFLTRTTNWERLKDALKNIEHKYGITENHV